MKPEYLPSISTNNVLRPTFVEINLEQLKLNYLNIKQHVGNCKIMPILKANAYGHGLIRVAKLMQEINADYLGVAVLEEGIFLRESGITLPILILGGILGDQIPLFLKHNLTITASSLEKIKHISEIAKSMNKTAKVHLKIDTGMERLGVHYYNAENFISKAFTFQNIEIEGLFSHFADSSSNNSEYTNLQIERFSQIVNFSTKMGYNFPLIHISNSGGILQYPNANFSMVRPGIMLYGVYPSNEVIKSVKVIPTLEWKSRVVYFKVIKSNHPVGYGGNWVGENDIRAVTIPVGYGDGYFRSMSGKAKVIIRNNKYDVIGTISMDQIIVNINWDSSFNNDDVVLLGKMGDQEITAENLAEWANTIPYEILTNINSRVPRIYKS